MTRQSTDTVIRAIDQQEGDRIAAAVLALVRSIVEPQVRAMQPQPTGCGHQAPENHHIVFDRSD